VVKCAERRASLCSGRSALDWEVVRACLFGLSQNGKSDNESKESGPFKKKKQGQGMATKRAGSGLAWER
jgi:hypothetical protein